jgi:hypothetical protein
MGTVSAQAATIEDFSPQGVQMFLNAHLEINTPADLLKSLPQEYRRHWIMMTQTGSAQPATPKYPRLLLPSADASKVFALQLLSNTKEARAQGDGGCQGCHAGRPNWDAYDSWAGMLPFNRGRIYKGSQEETQEWIDLFLKESKNKGLEKRLESFDDLLADTH